MLVIFHFSSTFNATCHSCRFASIFFIYHRFPSHPLGVCWYLTLTFFLSSFDSIGNQQSSPKVEGETRNCLQVDRLPVVLCLPLA